MGFSMNSKAGVTPKEGGPDCEVNFRGPDCGVNYSSKAGYNLVTEKRLRFIDIKIILLEPSRVGAVGGLQKINGR